MTDSLTNEYHAALVKIHDIARNGPRNTQSWQEVLEVVAAALECEHWQSKNTGRGALIGRTTTSWREPEPATADQASALAPAVRPPG